MTLKIFGMTILASLALFAQTAAAGDSYSCNIKSLDGKRLIPVTITPTGTRGGGGAYDVRTADFELPAWSKATAESVGYENNPLNKISIGALFVMETKSKSETATEFRVKFGFRYGFFSTQPEKSEIYINKVTGTGYFHSDIRNAFSLKHSKKDLEFTNCKALAGTWYDPQTQAKLWQEADAAAGKQVSVESSPASAQPDTNGSQTKVQ